MSDDILSKVDLEDFKRQQQRIFMINYLEEHLESLRREVGKTKEKIRGLKSMCIHITHDGKNALNHHVCSICTED